ncbi:hypothetical protein A5646_24970 [Mycobacterium sp. 1245499.0]|nr:hypothetical protein A5646_24970 [Mycobacterium sp. 1245499.0]
MPRVFMSSPGSRRRARRGGSLWGGSGRARGVRPLGLQTVPQEFVALVHGLLGCQAVDQSCRWSGGGAAVT